MDKLFTSRIKKLKSFLNKKELQNILILSDVNIFYLTGFYAKDSGSLLLVTNDRLYLLVSFIYLEQAKKSVQIKNINVVCYQQDKFKKLAEILEGYNFKSVKLEGMNISFTDFCKLEKMLSKQGKRPLSVDGVVERLRLIKDEIEIAKIRNACSITDKVFKNIISLRASKINSYEEIEIAYKIEECLVKNNSSGRSFDIVVAYDKNSSIPHYYPRKIKIKEGLVLMDFGCRFDNYCSDMTRTIFTKDNKICNEFKKIYDIVLEAQLTAIENCREGITCGELDKVARKFIISKGYGNNFGHGLGHGVGLEIHEEPAVKMGNRAVLKENMVITIEPAVYIENVGGVRIEDMVLVRKNECEVLNGSRKDFFILN